MNCIMILMLVLAKPRCEFILYLKVYKYNMMETYCNYSSRRSPCIASGRLHGKLSARILHHGDHYSYLAVCEAKTTDFLYQCFYNILYHLSLSCALLFTNKSKACKSVMSKTIQPAKPQTA